MRHGTMQHRIRLILISCLLVMVGLITGPSVTHSRAEEQPPGSSQVGQGSPDDVGTRGLMPLERVQMLQPLNQGVQLPAIVGAGRCTGPDTPISPNGTFPLTCPVNSPLGGNKMLVLPEVWYAGNGCIVTVDKPRVVPIGNNLGVTATMINRCGSGYKGTEGGLAWIILELK